METLAFSSLPLLLLSGITDFRPLKSLAKASLHGMVSAFVSSFGRGNTLPRGLSQDNWLGPHSDGAIGRATLFS